MLFTKLSKEEVTLKTKKKIDKFFEFGEIPENGPQAHYKCFRNQTQKWLGYDNLELFQENGGHHPDYDENSIDYTLNSKGYRCPEFNKTADIKIISLGCSYVFGVGLRQSEIFHEVIAEKLRNTLNCSVVNWNLGSSGASNDFVARALHASVPILKPDLVLINFTLPGRREIISSCGEWIKYVPSNNLNWLSDVGKEVHRMQKKIESEYQDAIHFNNLYRGIEARLANHNYVFSCIHKRAFANLGSLFDEKNVGCFKEVDKARDHTHPGARTHAIMAEKYFDYIKNSGMLLKLKEKVKERQMGGLSILQ